MDAWTIFWLALVAILLVGDLIAYWAGRGKGAGKTFSEHIWGRWFLWRWRRLVFLGSWVVVGVHFAVEGRTWYGSGWMVALWLGADAVIIVLRELELAGKEVGMGWLKKGLEGLKKAGGWVLRHGPVFSSAILGASFAFPALKPVAAALAGLTAGGGQVDGELTKLIGELFLGVIAMIGVVRKVWAKLPKS